MSSTFVEELLGPVPVVVVEIEDGHRLARTLAIASAAIAALFR